MIKREWKRVVCALGAVAAMWSVAACGGLREGQTSPASAFDYRSSGSSADPDAQAAAAGLPGTIGQLDDIRFTTIDLRHFAGYNNFRVISEAPLDQRASSPFVAADAQHRLLLRGGRSNDAGQLICVGKDAGM